MWKFEISIINGFQDTNFQKYHPNLKITPKPTGLDPSKNASANERAAATVVPSQPPQKLHKRSNKNNNIIVIRAKRRNPIQKNRSNTMDDVDITSESYVEQCVGAGGVATFADATPRQWPAQVRARILRSHLRTPPASSLMEILRKRTSTNVNLFFTTNQPVIYTRSLRYSQDFIPEIVHYIENKSINSWSVNSDINRLFLLQFTWKRAEIS